MSLKDEYIRQTENHINNLVQKRELLVRDLEDLDASEKEAREMLQFFKTGSTRNGSTKKKFSKSDLTTEDFREAVKLTAENKPKFTSIDVAEIAGAEYRKSISDRLRQIIVKDGNSGLVVKVAEGGPGVPAYYSLNPNYKG